jgi:hypothetical protein
VKQDRLIDNGVFKRKYMAHWMERREQNEEAEMTPFPMEYKGRS